MPGLIPAAASWSPTFGTRLAVRGVSSRPSRCRTARLATSLRLDSRKGSSVEGQERILSLFAFIAVDEDGTEGVPALSSGWPLMGADLARVESLRVYAQMAADQLGKPVTLAHFSRRTDQEVIQPNL